ncbi:copper homeostasis protein CutC [Flavobacteriaceae bacterium]|nr:copper homeostasis protein CutC [Flavobacteriaceae bacterium]
MIVEICVQSLDGAKMAQAMGADRLELCMGLEVGGLTPSMGLITQVKSQTQIPVHVLIRPRIGGFHYSPEEVITMIHDLRLAIESGADGIVIGALNPDFTLDLKTLERLIHEAKTLNPKIHITAHRAFDWVPNPADSVKLLGDLGCHTLLTSGQAPTAQEGFELLQSLNAQFGNQITIMPGSGINAQNRNLFAQAGFKAIHASASAMITERTPATNVSFEEQRQKGRRREINPEYLKNLLHPG